MTTETVPLCGSYHSGNHQYNTTIATYGRIITIKWFPFTHQTTHLYQQRSICATKQQEGQEAWFVTRKFEKRIRRLSLLNVHFLSRRRIYDRFWFPARARNEHTQSTEMTRDAWYPQRYNIRDYHEKSDISISRTHWTPTRYLTRYVDTRQILGNRAQLKIHATSLRRGFTVHQPSKPRPYSSQTSVSSTVSLLIRLEHVHTPVLCKSQPVCVCRSSDHDEIFLVERFLGHGLCKWIFG